LVTSTEKPIEEKEITLFEVQTAYQALTRLGNEHVQDELLYRIHKLLRQLARTFDSIQASTRKLEEDFTTLQDPADPNSKKVDKEKFEVARREMLAQPADKLPCKPIPLSVFFAGYETPEGRYTGYSLRPNDLVLLGPYLLEDMTEEEAIQYFENKRKNYVPPV